MPAEAFPSPSGYNAPEQVHITQGDRGGRGVIISWVTPDERHPDVVRYWSANDPSDVKTSHSQISTYRYYNYSSGYIHHATIRKLEVLGHYMANPKGQTVLFVGDLSYADDFPQHDQRKWDSWGRFIENSAAYQPWIWTAGNHELDFAPEIVMEAHLLFGTPSKEDQLISLSFLPTLPLVTELEKVDRHETPWLIVLMHTPLYNSDNYHYMEGESMRVIFEPWMVSFKVDLVLAGHVHAYERSERVSNIQYNITDGLSTPIRDLSAPVYITLGDGGNIEGIADNFIYPQPSYSAYREASFGHAMLEIKNRTHAYYTWHRNQDDEAVASDSTWFYNRFWYPRDESA
ncbi:purple acid phosphatase 19 isoform X2 [Beta vulgaris subsp. vulgaris]|uniref:purple acid phosphatase 19 isoform X2 n=1 Tax=Beta vulgaris subsp. vulgaris TaxID=3555 RepID=UPI002036A337|nr:purple acid phosphatase 19 isoform X2 [Beta vulgaris subsp. vulgaris]